MVPIEKSRYGFSETGLSGWLTVIQPPEAGRLPPAYSISRTPSKRACTSSHVGNAPKHNTRHCFSNSAARTALSSAGGNRASLFAKLIPGGGT